MQDNTKRIRLATVEDSSELLRIYAQYIDTPITFECVLPTCQEFAQRVGKIIEKYPYLVGEEGGKIIGYAYAHRQMGRQAYQWNAELSVYLDQNVTSQGWGKRLYQALMEILAQQGVQTVYGGVTLPNQKSARLHISLGFEPVGTYHSTGYKCGKWHDVVWFERAIGPYGLEPQPVVPIWQIPQERIQGILKKHVSEQINETDIL